MMPEHRTPTHPGEVLVEEFLQPLGVTQVAFAAHIGVSVQRVNEVVSGERGVTPETAWRPTSRPPRPSAPRRPLR
jgi:addiction module HigA family antidote